MKTRLRPLCAVRAVRARLIGRAPSLLLGQAALAVPDLSGTPSFQAAAGVRPHMDVGGAWDGSQGVSTTQGDTLSILIENDAGAMTAFDLTMTVELDPAYLYVGGTASWQSRSRARTSGASPPTPSLSPTRSRRGSPMSL